MTTRRARRKQQQKSNRGLWWIGGITVVILAAVALIIISNNSSASQAITNSAPPAPAPLDKCGGVACGQANAPVTIDIFSDFQCPYCDRFEPILQQLAPGYVDTGKVKLVYHNFTVIGPESTTAAEGAMCAADQERFWSFAHNLFADQGAENSGVFSSANVKKLAAAAGLDPQTFNSCLDTRKYGAAVSAQLADGRQRGVQATPTIFVNGKKYEGGLPYAQLAAVIDAAQPK